LNLFCHREEDFSRTTWTRLNSKHQIPNKSKNPNGNDRNLPGGYALRLRTLEIGIYLGFGAWNLEFMIRSGCFLGGDLLNS
jgi:hypothetical protein